MNEAIAAITAGNHEGFLAICTNDTKWTFVGESVLRGKEAVRQWMAITYREPRRLTVTHLIAEGEFVVALGDISTKDPAGPATRSSYCDVWRFRGGKLAALNAYVIAPEVEDETGDAP